MGVCWWIRSSLLPSPSPLGRGLYPQKYNSLLRVWRGPLCCCCTCDSAAYTSHRIHSPPRRSLVSPEGDIASCSCERGIIGEDLRLRVASPCIILVCRSGANMLEQYDINGLTGLICCQFSRILNILRLYINVGLV